MRNQLCNFISMDRVTLSCGNAGIYLFKELQEQLRSIPLCVTPRRVLAVMTIFKGNSLVVKNPTLILEGNSKCFGGKIRIICFDHFDRFTKFVPGLINLTSSGIKFGQLD